MNKKNIVLISDAFADTVIGGAELYNEELLRCLVKNGYVFEKLKSVEATPELISQNKEPFYIIANFMLLSEASKNLLMTKDFRYLILEHDHKYCKSNNPVLFENNIVPEDQIINKEFYSKAVAVCCQSKLHAETIQKNILLKNIVNLGCNLWADDFLNLLEQNIGKIKTRKFGVMQTNNRNKGMFETQNYCRRNKIEYEMIPFCRPNEFVQELAKTDTLVFFPQWMETFCRVAIEARILGCKLITNKSLGCASEPLFSLKGKELLDAVRAKKEEVINTFIKIIEEQEVKYFNEIKLPKISVITTIYKAGEHIKGFLDAFVQQTFAYPNIELIIIDANSPDDERKIIFEYMDTYDEIAIQYIRKDAQITPMEAFNEATKMATGELITCVLVDDRMAKDHVQVLSKHLMYNPKIDLVYGDCLQTTKPNETVDQNSSRGRLYEHSRNDFSKENMIKCLPGPMPMYRKSLHDKAGLWDEKLKHAGDWELWLRAVRAGSIFKKINKVVGLYFFNPKGLSTTTDNDTMLRRRKEERIVFHEFKDVIGESNYNTFKDYFDAI